MFALGVRQFTEERLHLRQDQRRNGRPQHSRKVKECLWAVVMVVGPIMKSDISIDFNARTHTKTRGDSG